MYRKPAILSVLAIVALGVLFIGSSSHSVAQDSDDDRISVLETQVAELEATVAALTGSEPESNIGSESENAPMTPIGTMSASADAPTSAAGAGYLSGNAFELLPAGNAGEFAVVSNGIYDGTSLPVLLRNNTADALVRAVVSVSVYDASGTLLAVGEANNLTPARIEPGGYAFGSVYFDFATFPSDVTYDFRATGESAESASFIGIYDLSIQEASYLGDRIVGTALNDQDVTLQAPFAVNAACFGADGSLLGIANDFAAAETADPGVSVPFQVTIYNVASCDIYLVGGSGFHF